MRKFNRDKYLNKIKLRKKWHLVYKKVFIILPYFICTVMGVYFAYSKFFVKQEVEVVRTTVGKFSQGDLIIGAYINDKYSSLIPKKDDGYIVESVICDNEAVGSWNDTNWSIEVKNLTQKTKCNIYFKFEFLKEYDYTGDVQKFTVPKSGVYKLEVWGAEGGSNNENDGGYGGYASGLISLAQGDNLNIAIGGTTTSKTGGYNGGGAGGNGSGSYGSGLGGGGATSITSSLINDGQLANYENNKDAILIVAGGGGGVNVACASFGGSGGGMNGAKNAVRTDGRSGGNSNYGTQTSGYAFGQGQPGKSKGGYANCGSEGNGGGGGGFYGGFSYQGTGQYSNESGGGGSGYIGNSLLTSKTMYCYSCTESTDESTKTISTTCSEKNPTENCAKKGNGYARITFIKEN